MPLVPLKDEPLVQLYLGDNREEIKAVPDNSVDLIVTSPPYANQRKDTYGGVTEGSYIEWFLVLSEQLLRVLKPTGTFILNIKENTVDKERDTYVIELVLALRKQGWFWTEEFIWIKPNSPPGKWPNRFRDGWEHLYQFNKSQTFYMDQDAVKVPASEAYIAQILKIKKKSQEELDTRRFNSTGSGVNFKPSTLINKDRSLVYPNNVLKIPISDEEFNEWIRKMYPDNVLELSVAGSARKHSAVFPETLPEWFIKLFTKEGDTVLEPFAGSGTTLKMAKIWSRKGIGFEIVPEYIKVIKERLKEGKSESSAIKEAMDNDPKQRTFFSNFNEEEA
jgi:site-specific DNA-methyltransferase (adenine-specific)